MKAERRHDLKTNALARGLEGMPTWGRRYGSHAVTVVLVILIVILAIQWWQKRARAQSEAAATALDDARRSVSQVRQLAMYTQSGAQAAVPALRDQVTKSAELAVSTVLDSSTDPSLRAQALNARGNLNWELAHLPPLPGAATRPALAPPEPPEAYLKKAEQAYQQVVSADNAPAESVAVARLSLAAIAEDRQQWDAAQKAYEGVMESSAIPQAFKTVAVDRLSRLADLRRPPLIGQLPATRAMSPESLLDSLRDLGDKAASTQPTTAPATQAAAEPTTAPAAGST